MFIYRSQVTLFKKLVMISTIPSRCHPNFSDASGFNPALDMTLWPLLTFSTSIETHVINRLNASTQHPPFLRSYRCGWGWSPLVTPLHNWLSYNNTDKSRCLIWRVIAVWRDRAPTFRPQINQMRGDRGLETETLWTKTWSGDPETIRAWTVSRSIIGREPLIWGNDSSNWVECMKTKANRWRYVNFFWDLIDTFFFFFYF